MDANWSPNGNSLVFASVAGVSKNADLHHRPQVQERFHIAWFEWTLFSPLVAGRKIHFGNNSRPLP